MIAQAQSVRIAELDHRQLFEYLTNILRSCMPECLVNNVQVEGKPDPISGNVSKWFLTGSVTRKINLGHTKQFQVEFNPNDDWSDAKITQLMERLVPSIRQSFHTNRKLRVTK